MGLHKTGTSTIQNFLNSNREKLREYGYFYPETTPFEAHHAVAAILKSEDFEVLQARELFFSSLKEFKRLSEGKTVILSSEMFCERADPEKFIGIADIFEDVTFCFYVREQVSAMESAFNQMVRQNFKIEEFTAAVPYILDVYNFIHKFSVIPGIRIQVFEFSNSVFVNNNLVDDFCERVMSLSDDHNGLNNISSTNFSLSCLAIETIRRLNHDKELISDRDALFSALNDIFPREVDEQYTLYTPEFYEMIRTKAEYSNELLRNTYLLSGDMKLSNVQSKQFLSTEEFKTVCKSRNVVDFLAENFNCDKSEVEKCLYCEEVR